MPDGSVLAVIAVIFGGYLLVHAAVTGVKHVVHGAGTAIHHVLHPHEKTLPACKWVGPTMWNGVSNAPCNAMVKK